MLVCKNITVYDYVSQLSSRHENSTGVLLEHSTTAGSIVAVARAVQQPSSCPTTVRKPVRVQFMSMSQNWFLSKLVSVKTGFYIYLQISQYLKSESETKIEFYSTNSYTKNSILVSDSDFRYWLI
jgi:hypothetical protein